MTTLLHLNQTFIDIQDRLNREQGFSRDSRRVLLNGAKLLREALDALERDIAGHFDERDRSIALVMGNSQPYTTVIDDGVNEQAALEGKKATGNTAE
jgi:hypothetical protein